MVLVPFVSSFVIANMIRYTLHACHFFYLLLFVCFYLVDALHIPHLFTRHHLHLPHHHHKTAALIDVVVTLLC